MCTALISDVYGGDINNRTALSCFSCAVLATSGEKEDLEWHWEGDMAVVMVIYCERRFINLCNVINEMSSLYCQGIVAFVNKFIVM
jgi:hypothetical protein